VCVEYCTCVWLLFGLGSCRPTNWRTHKITLVASPLLFLCYRFFTYNTLSESAWLAARLPSQLLRNAGIGLLASIISDTFVNALRVVKTTKQSIGTKRDLTYTETIKMILAADGWKGLFGRGLRARILANALQSIVFTVIWRGLADRWGKQRETARRRTTEMPETTQEQEQKDTSLELELEEESEHLIAS
jgi:hypothetical protein